MMNPAAPATRPWLSACLPSVADTCEAEMSSSLIGRAPVLSRLASCCAESMVKPPEMREPWPPPRPSGYWCQSICGTEISSLSSAMAKCWLDASPWAPSENSCPRWESLRVNFDHTPAPWPVKSKVTLGWPLSPGPLSKFCSGFLMSVPPRIGWSASTYQAAGGLALGSGCSARTITVPCGTLTICLGSNGIFLLIASFCRSDWVSSGPARTFLRSLSTR